MVERYTAAQVCDRIEVTGQQIKYVLSADYAALEAERDEWKRRCEAIVTELVPKPSPPNPTNPTAVDVAIWRESRSIHRRIERIAEGRDNG